MLKIVFLNANREQFR